MTRILTRYLTFMVLKHFLLFTAVVLILASLIQFMENRDGLLNDADISAVDIVVFSLLRAPEVFTLLAGFVTLVSIVFVYIALAKYSELKSVLAAGYSVGQFILALVPAALLVAGFHFFVENSLLPRSIEALRDWGVGAVLVDHSSGSGTIWAHQGNSIMAVGALDEKREILSDIELFRFDESGHVYEHVSGSDGRFADGELLISNVKRTIAGEPRLSTHREFRLETPLEFATLMSISLHPRQTSVWRIVRVLDQSNAASHPPYLYQLWFHKRLSAPLSTAVLILMLAPLAQRFSVAAASLKVLLGGAAVGFIFFFVDALLVAFGEAGRVPPIVAAWAPTCLLLISGLVVYLSPRRAIVKR